MQLAPLLAGVLALLGCRTPEPPSSTSAATTVAAVSSPYVARLGPDDRVSVVVPFHPELSTPPEGVPLDPAGGLHLPLVGRIELGGLDVAAANATVEAAFARFLHAPSSSLTVLEWQSRSYHVLGHVREPGRKPLRGALSAVEALSTGGAFLPGADRKRCFLVRRQADGLEVHTFDGESPDAAGFVLVAPGDVLVVRRTGTEDFQEDLLPILSGLGLSALYVSGRPILE